MDNIDATAAILKWQQELSAATTRAILAELQRDASLARIAELEAALAAD